MKVFDTWIKLHYLDKTVTFNVHIMCISIKNCIVNIVFQLDQVAAMIGGLVWGY